MNKEGRKRKERSVGREGESVTQHRGRESKKNTKGTRDGRGKGTIKTTLLGKSSIHFYVLTCSVDHFLRAKGAVVSLALDASPPPGLLHSVSTAAQGLGGPSGPRSPGEFCMHSSPIQSVSQPACHNRAIDNKAACSTSRGPCCLKRGTGPSFQG